MACARLREMKTTKTKKQRLKADPANMSLETNPVLKGGMPQALGMRVTSLTRKKVTGEMHITPLHCNWNGRVNGGAIMAFADALGAVGAVANRPPGYRGGTIESKTNFFAAGQGPMLLAISVPLHVGRTTSVWQTTIKNKDGRMVAIVTQTQISVPATAAAEE
jgi:1,4-dihydroxy-2-naphthoyl-CoA hydrolase